MTALVRLPSRLRFPQALRGTRSITLMVIPLLFPGKRVKWALPFSLFPHPLATISRVPHLV